MRGLGDFVSESRDWLTRLATGKAKRDEEMRSTVILRLTVQDVDSRDAEDIEVIASPDDSVGKLLKSLSVNPETRNCFVGATALDPRARLADSPLLPGAVLSVGGAGPDYQPVRGAAAGTLHVIAGPDAGFGVALRPGRYFIGRAAESHVCLQDKDVSRMHALVEVSPEGAAVISDRPAHGTARGSTGHGWPRPPRSTTAAWRGSATTSSAGRRRRPDAAGSCRPRTGGWNSTGSSRRPPRSRCGTWTRRRGSPAPRSFTAMVTSGLAGLAAGPALFLGSGSHNPVLLLGSLAGPARVRVVRPRRPWAQEGEARHRQGQGGRARAGRRPGRG